MTFRALCILLAVMFCAKAQAQHVLSLSDLQGNPQSLSDVQGKVVVLNFWATWCIPCRKEMPILSKLSDEFEAQGVRVLGAAAHPIVEAEKVERATRKLKMTFPTWIGATTLDMRGLGLGVSLPATAVLNSQGEVTARFPGVVTEAALREAIEAALASGGTAAAVNDHAHDHDHGHDHDHDHDVLTDPGEAQPHDHGFDDTHDHGEVGEQADPATNSIGHDHDHQPPGQREADAARAARKTPASLVPS